MDLKRRAWVPPVAVPVLRAAEAVARIVMQTYVDIGRGGGARVEGQTVAKQRGLAGLPPLELLLTHTRWKEYKVNVE